MEEVSGGWKRHERTVHKELTSSTPCFFMTSTVRRTSVLAIAVPVSPDVVADGDGDAPIPRFRQFLCTLSIAIYPLFVTSRCMLCLQTMTPTGSDD